MADTLSKLEGNDQIIDTVTQDQFRIMCWCTQLISSSNTWSSHLCMRMQEKPKGQGF